MKKSDLWWLIALPLYQFIGTARHELAHAAMAGLQGATLTRIQLIPSIHPDHGLLWGHVKWTGGAVDWLTTAAPYFGDILLAALCVPLCLRLQGLPRWLWLNLFILGTLSPLADVAYNYQKVFTRRDGDMNRLMAEFPPGLVHLAVLSALAMLLAGSAVVWMWGGKAPTRGVRSAFPADRISSG